MPRYYGPGAWAAPEPDSGIQRNANTDLCTTPQHSLQITQRRRQRAVQVVDAGARATFKLIDLTRRLVAFVIRGEPLPRTDLSRTRRLAHDDDQSGDKAAFAKAARLWFAVDLDKIRRPVTIRIVQFGWQQADQIFDRPFRIGDRIDQVDARSRARQAGLCAPNGAFRDPHDKSYLNRWRYTGMTHASDTVTIVRRRP